MILAFICGILTDLAWGYWTKAVNNNQPWKASSWNLLTHLMALVFTLLVIDKDILNIAVYLFGCFIGCFWSTKKSHGNIIN